MADLPEFADLTWEDARAVDRARAVAILPVGAIEAHGPHLPLATDGIIALAMARAGAARLGARGLAPLVLPLLPYTPARFAAAFAGTLSVRPETLTALLVDVARALAGHGFRALAIANAHLDPAHLGALDAAVQEIAAGKILAVAFPNLARKAWASRLTDEFKSGACHAGRFEGSIVLAERPDLVRTAIARDLPANPSSLSTAIRAGKQTFEESGGPRAYFGDPAAATADEGRRTIETLGAILEEAVVAALGEP